MNKCIDCGTKVSRKEYIRCKKCFLKIHLGRKYPICKCGKMTKDYNSIQCSNCYLKTLKGTTSPKYKNGLPHCIDCKKELSRYDAKRCTPCANKFSIIKRLKNRRNYKGINNPNFGKVSHGKWSKYKNIWMRSSYEVAYAKYLDKNKIKWLYESKTFDLGNYTYTPDFYLPKFNLYIEIKGFWRDDAKKKFKLFKIIYPREKITILQEKELKKLNILKK
jgi:hypothetical protein